MPANIFERIADILGLPTDRSEKLVRAMIREIRKRARKGRGVKIPNLGSFAVEDGQLTFTPAKSLARAVNQRFEGLGDEQVALPELDEQSGTGEGPTTITRGFDMGAWDPLDTGGESTASGTSSTSTSGGADTDEFQIAQEAPDTDEFEIPGGSDQDSNRDAPRDEAPRQEVDASTKEPESDPQWDVGPARSVEEDDSSAEDAFPSPDRLRGEESARDQGSDIDPSAPLSVDDHRAENVDDDSYDDSGFSFSNDPDERAASVDDADADEPNPWAAESAWDLSTVTSSDVDDSDDVGDDPATDPEDPSDYPSYRPPDADEQEAENQPSRSIFDFDEEEEEPDSPKRDAPKTTKIDVASLEDEAEEQETSSSSAATVISVVVILFLALAGGWIVLGQQGIVPAPDRVLGLEKGLTTSSSPSASNDAEEAPSTVSSSQNDASATETGSPQGQADETTAPEETTEAGNNTQRGFDSQQGGFTIAVASRSTRSGAQAMVEQFRRNLADTNLPVDIVTATTNGTTRYRVGVGQFSTRAAANETRRELQTRLPDGAWPVPIDGE